MQYLAFDCNERKVLHESTREVDGEIEIFKCDPFTESYRTAEIAPNFRLYLSGIDYILGIYSRNIFGNIFSDYIPGLYFEIYSIINIY